MAGLGYLVVVQGTLAVVQGTTAIMSRVFNKDSVNLPKDKHNFFCFFATSDNNSIINLNDYPLNLLFYINILLYGALIFLYIILNIYISKYISSIIYTNFIPSNKFGKMLNFFVSSIFENMK